MNTPAAKRTATGGQFELYTVPIPSWPKLAWVARCQKDSKTIMVYHGPMVETADQWAVEAVWAGDYGAGGFDETDLVFGTGLRIRGDGVVFVSSGSSLDRLHATHCGTCTYVSNSLPALLACSEGELLDAHNYAGAIKGARNGRAGFDTSIPVHGGEVRLIYFDNLLWSGGDLHRVTKPAPERDWGSYEEYLGFLQGTARHLAANAAATGRAAPVRMLTSVSSGYDSVAASVIAVSAGCRKATTIRRSSSLWRGSDSGEEIARRLGLQCHVAPRSAPEYPWEETFWAVAGSPGILNWSLFPYPEPLGLFFTGCHGDVAWKREESVPDDPYRRPSIADLGIGEFRLHKGVFHAPVPYWGIQSIDALRRISCSAEMRPWSVRGSYDRPIARRIGEEAGIPRHLFGTLKKNTSLEARFHWPVSRSAQKSYADYLRRHGRRPIPRPLVGLVRSIARADQLMRQNIRSRWLRRPARPWDHYRDGFVPFLWANDYLRDQYAAGLREAGVEGGR